MDQRKLSAIVESIQERGLRVKVYENSEDESINQVDTDSGTSVGNGKVTVLIIRE